jgi:hypothetical protein
MVFRPNATRESFSFSVSGFFMYPGRKRGHANYCNSVEKTLPQGRLFVKRRSGLSLLGNMLLPEKSGDFTKAP